MSRVRELWLLVLLFLALAPSPIIQVKAIPDLLTLRPNASGYYQDWSLTDTTHYGATSDQSDLTYVYVTDSTTLKETENLADTSQTGTITSVTTYMRAKAFGNFANEQAVILWRTYSNDYESAGTTISRSAFTDYSEERTVNPYTSAAWTWTEVNALQIGSRASTLGNAISYIGAGTGAGGTGDVTPTLPTGWAQNDIFLLYVESNTAVTAPTGWAFVNGFPISGGTTAPTSLNILWRRATSSESNPTVTGGSDHKWAIILDFRGCITSGNPWDITNTGINQIDNTVTALSANGVTTTVPNTLIVVAGAHSRDNAGAHASAWSNPNLSNPVITEAVDSGTNAGSGGGIFVAYGGKASAGATGPTTLTYASATTQTKLLGTIALKPQVETIQVSEYWIVVNFTPPAANDPPTNDQASITDMDDVDNLYAQKKWYTLDYDVSDLQGYADIDYAEARLKQEATTRAIFRYDEDTNTFTLELGSDKWELDISGSSAIESGNSINMTFKIKPQFDAIEEADLEIECYVVDDEPTSDLDVMQTNYADVVVNLLISSIECTDPNTPDRVDVSSTITVDFSVRYANDPGSAVPSTSYPPDAEFTSVSVHDSSHFVEATDTSIINGDGSVSFYAKSTVQSMLYHCYINMLDPDYPDGDESPTEQVISDRMEIVSVTFDDNRVNIQASAEVRYTLRYDYDDDPFTDADGSISGFVYDAGGYWKKTVTAPSTPSYENYDENDLGTLTDNNYGLTVYEDDAGANLIGDRITFLQNSLEVTDGRINFDSSGEWYAELKYEYDNAEVDDGSVTLNTGSMTWDAGQGRWEYQYSKGSVGAETRNIASVSGNLYGITALNSAVTSDSETIIYDGIVAYWEQLDDARVDISTNIEWRIRAVLDYDDTPLGSGDTLTSSWGDLTWDAGNSWFEISHSESSVTSVQISLTAGTETSYSITKFSENITETSGIYDRIVAYWEQLDDTRVNKGSMIEWRIRALLDYDDHPLASGDTLSCSWGSLSWDPANSWFDTSHAESTVGAYKITLTAGSEATYGITAFTENITETSGIYDQIVAYWEELNDTRVDVSASIEWRVRAVLDYDDHPLGSGDAVGSSWGGLTWDDGNSWFEIPHSESTVKAVTILLNSGSEATYGITLLTENITETSGIYDRLAIVLEADDYSVLLETVVNFTVTVTYEYDSTTCTTWQIDVWRNGTADWKDNLTNSEPGPDFTDTSNVTATYIYDVTQDVSETTYGLTGFSEVDSISVTWSEEEEEGPAPVTGGWYRWKEFSVLVLGIEPFYLCNDIIPIRLRSLPMATITLMVSNPFEEGIVFKSTLWLNDSVVGSGKLWVPPLSNATSHFTFRLPEQPGEYDLIIEMQTERSYHTLTEKVIVYDARGWLLYSIRTNGRLIIGLVVICLVLYAGRNKVKEKVKEKMKEIMA